MKATCFLLGVRSDAIDGSFISLEKVCRLHNSDRKIERFRRENDFFHNSMPKSYFEVYVDHVIYKCPRMSKTV